MKPFRISNLLIFVLFLFSFSCNNGSVDSLQKRAQKIKKDMTYEQVSKLMGSSGEEKLLNTDNPAYKYFAWEAQKPDKGRTLVTFLNNRATGVSSSNNWKPEDFFGK